MLYLEKDVAACFCRTRNRKHVAPVLLRSVLAPYLVTLSAVRRTDSYLDIPQGPAE